MNNKASNGNGPAEVERRLWAYLANHAKGAAYLAVTAKDFEAALMLVPGDSLLCQFHDNCEPTSLLKENLLRKNTILRRYRDLLLLRLLSGQVNIREN